MHSTAGAPSAGPAPASASAPGPSASAAAVGIPSSSSTLSSLASHPPHFHRPQARNDMTATSSAMTPRGSVLRQHSDEERQLQPMMKKSGGQSSSSSYSHSNNINSSSNGSRPASKARRTSSGGSRVTSEEVNGQYMGSQNSSSASDSGSDWRHGPKVQHYGNSSGATIHNNNIISDGNSNKSTITGGPDQPSHQTSSSADARTAGEAAGGHSGVDGRVLQHTDKRPERASTSSNYFSKAAAAAAAVAAASSSSNSSGDGPGETEDGQASRPHLDLAKYPAQELLRILAALLAQIAAANDQLRPRGAGASATSSATSSDFRQKGAKEASNGMTASSSGASVNSVVEGNGHAATITGDAAAGTSTANGGGGSASGSASTHPSPGLSQRPTTAALTALQAPSSTLCFHARNIPSIGIESYLLRILKYCPATNEVFLSLLIYFDRMSKMGGAPPTPNPKAASASTTAAQEMHGDGSDGNAATANGDDGEAAADIQTSHAGMKGFAIDSYNVHRLVIAGVTVASKFFSDVFYTNSRYAKVGGLPVHELNQLELQFLLLNDFKLVIPLEEMQRYADQLLVYGGVPRSTWADEPSTTSPSAEQGSRQSRSRGASPRHHQASADVAMRDAPA